ncbi:MAG TPA: PQQ-binding-like beta-propeller repeat protein, partial [Fimbriimonadaceae bacterium]|nr:PQQ-binding-like beta-propeller repeat protein [Fimbriimonadaceae bacterium]
MMAFALGFEKSPPPPPYRRAATAPVFAMSYEPPYIVGGTRFYSAWSNSCVAFDLPSMKRAWAMKFGEKERPAEMALYDGALYLTTEGQAKGRLIAVNAKSGKVLWTVSRTGRGSAMAVDRGTLFVSMKPNTLSALDLKTRRAKWTASLAAPQEGSDGILEINALEVADGRVIANHDATTYGLDEKTGKRIWRVTGSYVFRGALAVVNGVAWIPSGNGAEGVDIRSGKVLWDGNNSISDYSGVLKGRFVGLSGGQVVCVEPRSGKTLWSHRLGDPNTSGGRQYGAVLGDHL